MVTDRSRGQIVVLGMHRSGTSAVCRTLGFMGCFLGPADAFHPADRSNEKGYWERTDLWALNESTLASLGSTWCDVASLAIPGHLDPMREKFGHAAREIVAMLDPHEPWAIKDPRLSVLFSLWRPVTPDAVCVLTYRSPLEIARSLQRRDGLSLPFGIALWERYSRSALADSSGMKRVLLRYRDLVVSPLETAHHLFEELRAAGVVGLHEPSKTDLESFIEASLHREKGDDGLENRLLSSEQRELRDALRDGSAIALDTVAPLSAIAEEELKSFSAGEARAKVTRAETDLLRDTVRRQDEGIQRMVLEKDTYIRSLEVEREKLETGLRSERQSHQTALASLEALIADKDRYAASLERERLKLDSYLKDHVARSAGAYAALEAAVAEKDRHSATAEQRIRELELGLLSSRDEARALSEENLRIRSGREEEADPSAPVPADWTGFAVCTIVAKNYLSMARVCCGSFLKHHPGARAFVLLADRREGLDLSDEAFEVLTAEELGIPSFDSFAFQYNILEFSTALKPFVLRHLFETRGMSALFYLDPDIMVFGPMVELRNALESSDVVLTPHVLSPLRDDGRRPSENDFLISGVYNLGFIALRNSSTSLDLLQWWEARLQEGAFSDPAQGLFTDQKWINLAPGHFPGVRILRHPGYNAAYWNIQERLQLEAEGDCWRINGGPLRFFHFSGFQKSDLEGISKYQNRYRLADLGRHYRALFEGYARALDAAGWSQALGLRYSYGFFDNGARIPDSVRRIYYNAREGRLLFGNPFETAHEASFFEWMMRPHRPGSVLSRIHLEVLRLRGDVAAAFPDPERVHAEAFLTWVVDHSESDLGLNDPYQGPFRAQLDAVSEARRHLEREEAERIENTCRLERKEAERTENARRAAEEEAQRRELLARLQDGEPQKEWKRWIEAIVGTQRYRFFRRRLWKVYGWLRGNAGQVRPGEHPAEFQAPPQGPPPMPEVSSPPSSPPAVREATAPRCSPPSVQIDAPCRPFGVNLFGYFETESGVGEVARGLAGMLKASGTPHVLCNIDQAWLRQECRTGLAFSAEHPYAVNLLAVNADQAPHVAGRFGLSRSPDQYFVGYWFWELSSFPERLSGSFSLFDEIWVATDFCLGAISRAGTVPVTKVPPAFEPVPLNRHGRADFGFAERDFVFLYVFDSASIVARKNPAGAISAFRRAFGPDDPVRLVLKTTNASPRKLGALQRLAGPSRTQVWNGYFDRGKLLDLVAASDAYVSLHRSEGLGLTLLEAMMLGKPVVATDYSGVRDFLRGPLAFPVGYEVTPLLRDRGPYPKGSSWADPDIAAAARQMRHIYDVSRTEPGWLADVERSSRETRYQYGIAATSRVLEERLALIRRSIEGRTGRGAAETTQP